MIKAQLIERYIHRSSGSPKGGLETIVHEERLFSSDIKLKEWFDTFKGKLWADDPSKVKLVEGLFVVTEVVEIDDLEPPKEFYTFASFREGVSYKYAS